MNVYLWGGGTRGAAASIIMYGRNLPSSIIALSLRAALKTSFSGVARTGTAYKTPLKSEQVNKEPLPPGRAGSLGYCPMLLPQLSLYGQCCDSEHRRSNHGDP